MATIPNIFHFCYFGGKPFSLVNYLTVKSARDVNVPEKMFMYLDVEPTGEWWEKSKSYLSIIPTQPPTEIYGIAIPHPAHRADIVRLQKLIETGGIYLDLDVICEKPFTDLLNNRVVLGEERFYGAKVGLCNGVILAQAGESFLQRWLDGFNREKSLWKGFRSTGIDLYYSEMSVKYSNFLSMIYPEEVHVEPTESFFYPNYEPMQLKEFFTTSTNKFNGGYCHHLWTNSAYDLYLKELTVEKLSLGDTAFSKLASKFIEPNFV